MLTRTVIDLTGEDTATATGTLKSTPAYTIRGASSDFNGYYSGGQSQRPAKRRRLAVGKLKRSLQECVSAQVLPHLNLAFDVAFPGGHVKANVMKEALKLLVESPRFRIRLDETNGYLGSQDEAEIKIQATEVVRRLVELPQYAVQDAVVVPTIEESVDHTDKTKGSLTPKPRAGVLSLQPAALVADGTERSAAWIQASTYKPWKRRALTRSPHSWFRLQRRPYQNATDRESIRRGLKWPSLLLSEAAQAEGVYHVDFSQDEVAQLIEVVKKATGYGSLPNVPCLESLCLSYNIPSLVGDQLRGRTTDDIRNFCSDLMKKRITPTDKGHVLSLEYDAEKRLAQYRQAGRVETLLLAREMEANLGFGRMRRLENFQTELKIAHEDALSLIAEFTNCAGDIATISWTSDHDFIAGTTAHSDAHNQQYNKPGNLLLCSTTKGTLRASPDHRIPRPVVEKGENSTEAMRQSQDPWLYCSVVSSDYDAIRNLAYTSSFDKTVKVWRVGADGDSMQALATWQFEGNVNFVAAAKDGSGHVAAAADVPSDAVRVYTVNEDGLADGPCQVFSCPRPASSDKWAYYPATMQWGRVLATRHLLVVGYSPRSLSGHDIDIPEDKGNSGSITVWDAARGCRIPVLTATTANVFEVVWHPTLNRFFVATSPSALTAEHRVRTQIHMFQQDRERADGAYSEFQCLDCFASDINELTIMPNSVVHAYVTAACTDGNVYVWDTAQGDKPIHILRHGDPLDEFHEDREREDTGVKFTAWGTTTDRLYTGSSDGVVKVWNIRHKRRPWVRNLLEAPGPISCGAFSPDQSKLAVGDATGRVFLLSVDERDAPEAHFATLPGMSRRIRRPKPFIPHHEPPPPESDDAEGGEHEIATYARRTYLESNQLILNRNPVVGVIQGPEYSSTGLFRKEAHLDDDSSGPLLPEYERLQQDTIAASWSLRPRSMRRLKEIDLPPSEALEKRHEANKARDLHVNDLEGGLLAELLQAGVQFDSESEDWGFDYEESPDL